MTSTSAVMLYAPTPLLAGSTNLFGFCLRRVHRDAARILLSLLAVGALALAAPLITEVLIDSVIPRADFDQLIYCAAGIAMVAIGIAGFQAAQSIGALRLEGALAQALQAGVVDWLLRLPVSFFRQYSAGDLVDRVLGIESIRQLATGYIIRGLMGAAFAAFSFALMFYFDAGLALIATGLTVLRGALIVTASVARLKRERLHFEMDGKVQGLVLQLIVGLGKLRR